MTTTLATESTTPQSGRIVTVARRGHFLILEPPCPELLRPLATVLHAAAWSPSAGYVVRALPIPLWCASVDFGRPVLVCGAGLEPVVCALLQRAGVTIRRTSRSLATLPRPNLEAVQRRGPVDQLWLETVPQYDRALIYTGPQRVDRAWLGAQVARAWPQTKIAFVVSWRDEARAYARKLRRYGVRATVQTGQRNLADIERVVVATYQGLLNTAFTYDVSWLDVVVVLDAHEALGQQAQPSLAAAFRARLYGLLARNDRPAPYASDQLRALFGFREVVVPQHGCAERPVRVVWQAIRGGPTDTSKSSPDLLERKRQGKCRTRMPASCSRTTFSGYVPQRRPAKGGG